MVCGSWQALSRTLDILGIGVNGGVAVLRQQQKKKKGDKTGRQIVRTIEPSECGRRSPLTADARFCQEETVKEERGEGRDVHPPCSSQPHCNLADKGHSENALLTAYVQR